MKKEWILLLVFLVGCQITGFAILEADTTPPVITPGNIRIFDTSAEIEWQTDEITTSTLSVGKTVLSFESSASFAATVKALKPGRLYDYSVTACDDAYNCVAYNNKFTTLAQAKPTKSTSLTPLTGAVVIDVNLLRTAQSVAVTAMYALLGLVGLIVVVRVGYSTITEFDQPERQIKGTLREAEDRIKKNRHGEAYEYYNSARELYKQLKPARKLKHYDKLISVYTILLEHKRISEAQYLTDRYKAGIITKEELDRLRDLLTFNQ